MKGRGKGAGIVSVNGEVANSQRAVGLGRARGQGKGGRERGVVWEGEGEQ